MKYCSTAQALVYSLFREKVKSLENVARNTASSAMKNDTKLNTNGLLWAAFNTQC
jgi:hypothetical protein